jgi:GT2 family glycosyltransferase
VEGSGRTESCHKADAVNAAVVLYTNDALNKTGIYDERFGSYLEDIDHSLRLSRNGFDNIVVTNAKVIHVGQSTSKSIGVKKQFYDARNWWLVIFKNWRVKKTIRYFPSIIMERLRNLSGILKAIMSV